MNLFAVKWYGETEFWLALGKVLLIIGLIIYTFIAMLGGNPLGDRFGFRYWNNPGSFTELYYGGSLGRFLGFLQCLIQASFTIAGPDYVSMASGEAENPRKVMPKAFKAVFYRLTTFFMLGSLCVGILVPYNDPELTAAFENGEPGAAASPYVVSMNRLHIQVLPHIVNAMVLGSAFSAGNSYVYCASRSMYGMALEGKAPKIFRKCTRNGVPIYCVLLVLLLSLLSFLQVSNSASVVLNWFVSLVSLVIPFLMHVLIHPGNCVPTHQLLSHDLHIPEMEESVRNARLRPETASTHFFLAAIHRLLRTHGNHDHDVRGRIYSIPSRILGRAKLPVQLHYDCCISYPVLRMEIRQEDEVAQGS
jgi:amino acid permease